MPDIQTALTTALSKMSVKEMNNVNNLLETWADAETTMTPSSPPKANKFIKNNVTREVFNFVKDNPGTTRRNVMDKLEAKGYKPSSTSSLITQFVRDTQFKNQLGGLYAVSTEYRNLPQSKKRKVVKKVAAVKKPTPVAAVPETPKAPVLLVRRPMPSFNAQEMVNRWSAYQAREVYQELKSIFGG
jgi:hypothetical protein